MNMGGSRIKLFCEEHTHFHQLSLVDSIHFIRSSTNDNDMRPFKMGNLDINTLNGSTSVEEVCSFTSIQAGWLDGWIVEDCANFLKFCFTYSLSLAPSAALFSLSPSNLPILAHLALLAICNLYHYPF